MFKKDFFLCVKHVKLKYVSSKAQIYNTLQIYNTIIFSIIIINNNNDDGDDGDVALNKIIINAPQ